MGPGVTGPRLWDFEARFANPDMTAEACRGCQVICADCPRPRLLPECEEQVRAYLACRTQWRTGAMGGRLGLDYAGVRAALDALHPSMSPTRSKRLFAGVQVIELALLEVQAEQSDTKRGG